MCSTPPPACLWIRRSGSGCKQFTPSFATADGKRGPGAATSSIMVPDMHHTEQTCRSPRLKKHDTSCSGRTGVAMRPTFFRILRAEDRKQVQRYSIFPSSSTVESSTTSSHAYALSELQPVCPRARATDEKHVPPDAETAINNSLTAPASVLQAAASTQPREACSWQAPLSSQALVYSQATGFRSFKSASLGSMWAGAASRTFCSGERAHRITKSAAPAAPAANSGCSRDVGCVPEAEQRCPRGMSPALPWKTASTVAWRATVAAADGGGGPAARRAVSLCAYKAAAFLLPPLLLTTCCCRPTYAATAAAPPPLMRTQSAFVPAITFAAISLTSSSPPSTKDLLKKSGISFSARTRSRCPALRATSGGQRGCKDRGLLQKLRRRSMYLLYPLEAFSPFSSWTAGWGAAGLDDDVFGRRRSHENAADVCACSSGCPSGLPYHATIASSSAGELAGPRGADCDKFRTPLYSLSSWLGSRWGGTPACYQTGSTSAVFGNSGRCSLTKQAHLSTVASVGHLFALASSVLPEGPGGGAREDGAASGAAGPEAEDRFHLQFHQPQHPAYDLVWQVPVKEMQLHVAYYVHRRTGVRVMSIAAAPQEKEKVFCVSFRTPVSDSTGVPHILEHSVLAGSKKYPLKEPFAELIKGSMYSFLNAYTYAEHTSYPVASVNSKDFYNLAAVYLDGVLQPLVVRDIHVFRQEGWRLEASLPETGGDSRGVLTPYSAVLNTEGAVNSGSDAAGQGTTERVAASSAATTAASAGESPAGEGRSGDELPLRERVRLSYQGVVLNEMKGVYSQPRWLAYALRMKSIFPDIQTYAQDSGGNPEVIPSLTHEKFIEFFRRYYTLSNARIFFWGSDDIYKRLDFVDKSVSELDEIPPRDDLADFRTRIPSQRAFKEPIRVSQLYPSTTTELEDYITVTWVLDPAPADGPTSPATAAGAGEAGQSPEDSSSPQHARVNATERLALTVLDHLLMGTPAAPLYKALASSHLGKEVIGGGLGEYKHFVFSAGLSGIPQEQPAAAGTVSVADEGGATEGTTLKRNVVERLEEVVLETLERCAVEGFEADAIEAALNTVEFRLREFNTGRFPKGLAVILQMVSDWMVDRDPLDSLRFERPLSELRKRLEAGEPVFQQILQKRFLNNPHRVTVHLIADADLDKEIEAKEEAKIEAVRDSLEDADAARLIEETQELKAKQLAPDSPEALATIPTLELSDIEEAEEIPTEAYQLAEGRVQVLLHRLPTAGILYADVALPLHLLTLEELQYLPLFARMLTQAGTSQLNEVELANYIGMHTGGVQASVDIRTIAKEPLHVPYPEDSLGFLVVSGKALSSKVRELYEIAALVLCDTNFSNSARGMEILKEIDAATAENFINSGVLAALRLGSSLTVAGYIAEQMGGVPYALFIRKQLQQARDDWEPIQKKLEDIRRKLLTATKPCNKTRENQKEEQVVAFVNLTGDTASLKSATSLQEKGGRMLRQLTKVLTGSMPAGLPRPAASTATTAQADPKETPQAQRDGAETPTITGSARGPFLQEDAEAADLQALEKSQDVQPRTRALAACGWSSILAKEAPGWMMPPTTAEGFVVPSQVNYVYLGGRMLSPGERFYGHFSVIAEALSNNYVWDQVRVVGGAYGGSFSLDGTGAYTFRSYRDPNLLNTVQRYREAAAGLKEFTDRLDKRTLTRGIISVLRELSQPQSNDQKGYTALWRHIAGETEEHRNQYRAEVVRTKPQHFAEFAARLQELLQAPPGKAAQETPCRQSGQSLVTVVGSEKAFEEATGGSLDGVPEHGHPGHTACPLRFKLVDVKKATAVPEAPGMDNLSVSS